MHDEQRLFDVSENQVLTPPYAPPSRHMAALAVRGRNYAIALIPEEDFNKEFGLEERQNDLLLTGQQQPQK